MIMKTDRAERIAAMQKAANDFAKSKEYDHALYETDWNGYSVYIAALESSTSSACGGYPQYILVDTSATRWSTLEETSAILSSL